MEDGRHTHNPAQDGDPGGEAEVGRYLEQARKEKGLSLEQVEQATKIRKRYLAGLERAEYAVLPDGVYAQGFLKTYANYLGLDGEALARQLKNRNKPLRESGIAPNTQPESGFEKFEKPLISPRGLRGTDKGKFPTSAVMTLVVAVVVLAAVFGALYFVGRGVEATRPGDDPQGAEAPPAQPGEDAPREAQEEVAGNGGAAESGSGADASEDDPQGEGSQQNAPPDTLQVVINVKERPSWLLIRTDGTVAYEQVAQPGFSETFETDRQLYIKAGDAGAVTVEVNGQDAGTLGRTGYIVDKTYTLKSAS